MSTYFTEGIILRHKNLREADRIVTIYTKDYGKIELLAQGSRKIRSKLAGSLEPFSLVNLMAAKGKNFDKITSVEVLRSYRDIKNDFGKITMAGYFAEMIDSFTKVHHRDSRIFNLIQEIFEEVANEQKIEERKQRYIWFFVWHLLFYLGYKPELYYCLHCKKRIKPNNNFFSISHGGLVCFLCQKFIADKISMANEAIKILRIISEEDFKKLGKIRINKKLTDEISRVTNLFLRYHLEKDMKSEAYLKII